MNLFKMTTPAADVYKEFTEYVLNPDSYKQYYSPAARAEEVTNRCGYGIGAGWHPARCGNELPCAEHSNLKCACGELATEACSYAGMLVCGFPACKRHAHNCGRHGK